MSEQALHCADCNVKFRTKAFDPSKAYKCPKCGGALRTAGAKPEAGDSAADKVTPSAVRPRWLKAAAWTIALAAAAVVGWVTGPRPRVNMLPEPKALTPRARLSKGKDARAGARGRSDEAQTAAGTAPEVTAGKDVVKSQSAEEGVVAAPSAPQAPSSASANAAPAVEQQAETAQAPQAKVDGVTQAALDALDSRLSESVLLRHYDEALGRCEGASRRLQKSGSSAAVVGRHVALWRAQIEACRSLARDAHTRAAGLVGKTVEVEIRMGKKGTRRVAGVLARFESGALFLRSGAKDTRVPVAELGPYDIVRIASGKDLLEARRRVMHARFLLTEGHEQDAEEELKCAEDQGRHVSEIAEACAEAREFFGFWMGRQQRLANERSATTAISDLKEVYWDGKWDDAARIATRLGRELGETRAYRDERTLHGSSVAGV